MTGGGLCVQYGRKILRNWLATGSPCVVEDATWKTLGVLRDPVCKGSALCGELQGEGEAIKGGKQSGGESSRHA